MSSAYDSETRNVQPPIIDALIDEGLAVLPAPSERPERCRVVIFDHDGSNVLGIGRNRPEREPYVVFPGGGLEPTDATPLDGVRRELKEELGLTEHDVALTDRAIPHGNEHFYLGYAPEPLAGLKIGGPEAERDASISGTYHPGWYAVNKLVELNAVPKEISEMLATRYDRV